MKLIEINKTHYRSTLNKVIVGFVIAFALLSVGFGTILIHFFGEVAVGDEPVNNFRFNLLGVILGLIVCTLVMNNIKNKPQMSEVYYVWQLKQLQNQIFRRLTKIKAAAKEDNIDALIVLIYYYKSLEKLYLLDDNTITISTVRKDISNVQSQIEEKNLSINEDDFDKTLIDKFK